MNKTTHHIFTSLMVKLLLMLMLMWCSVIQARSSILPRFILCHCQESLRSLQLFTINDTHHRPA